MSWAPTSEFTRLIDPPPTEIHTFYGSMNINCSSGGIYNPGGAVLKLTAHEECSDIFLLMRCMLLQK